MSETFHESFTAILKAQDILKSELSEDRFEFRCSDTDPVLSIVDLNCEKEHDDLYRIYAVGFRKGLYHLFFASELSYDSSFTNHKATELIDVGFEFEMDNRIFKLTKSNVSLEDLAEDVKFAADFLFDFQRYEEIEGNRKKQKEIERNRKKQKGTLTYD